MPISDLNLDAVRVGAQRSLGFAAEHANGREYLPEAVFDFFDRDVPAVLAELETVRRGRDSLARRCAARFEETEKLRAELETMTAIAQGNKRHVADLTYQLERVEALTKDAAGNDLNGAEIVVAGKIRRALYEPLPDTRPVQAEFVGTTTVDARPCSACDGRGLVPVGDDGELYECRSCDGVGGA